MVTVLKNVTNVITAIGEVYLFKKQHDNKVWAALFLMVLSFDICYKNLPVNSKLMKPPYQVLYLSLFSNAIPFYVVDW